MDPSRRTPFGTYSAAQKFKYRMRGSPPQINLAIRYLNLGRNLKEEQVPNGDHQIRNKYRMAWSPFGTYSEWRTQKRTKYRMALSQIWNKYRMAAHI